MSRRAIRHAVSFCFLLSGAAGLIYEVVWARQLSLFMGITTYANTAVITAYMLGLSAGGFLIGRVADRKRDTLRLYAWLEIGVGLYAASTPWLLPAMQVLYARMAGTIGVTGAASHLIRFLLALCVLLVPTFLMGGTLPVLIKGLARNLPGLPKETGRLYGINTLGATLGAFAAGYLLLPGVGVRGTIFTGVLTSFLVAGTVLLLVRRGEVPLPSPGGMAPSGIPSFNSAIDPIPPGTRRIILLGFALSGMAALVYELAWIRAFTLVVGSSVYAFSLTLTAYLGGLALGSLLYSRFLAEGRTSRRPGSADRGVRQAAVLEMATGVSAILGLPLIGGLPTLFLRGYHAGLQESFALFQGFIFILCFAVMLVPTLLLGCLFPLCTALWTRGDTVIGRGVGSAYAANTAGTVLGAMVGGLLLLPTLGVHRTILFAAGVHGIIGAGFWLARPALLRPALRWGGAAAALALLALVVTLIPPWDRVLMTSGPFVNAAELANRRPGQDLREKSAERELIYYAEGIDGIVCVEETAGERILVINGKDDASSRTDLPTQVLLGQLPMLVHPHPDKILVIGLGSGITLGSAATHLSAQRFDVLEISPEVVQASRLFAETHGDVLADPRVRLIVADARDFILSSNERYDVITSEPSNPWISGVSNLFTRDFFELASRRLADGGLMAQWLETYNMSAGDVKSVMATFRSVFPHVTVWMPMPGDLIMIGTAAPHALDYGRVVEALAQPAIHVDLDRIQMSSPGLLPSKYLLGGPRLATYVQGAALNTDDRPRIEFSAPRNLYANTTVSNMVDLVRSIGEEPQEVPVSGIAFPSDATIVAPGLHLTVGTEGGSAFERPTAKWLVQWGILPSSSGGVPELSVGTWRLLEWSEGTATTRVLAFDRAAAPSAVECENQLVSLLGVPSVRSGEIDLPDGPRAQWGIGADGAGRIRLGMTWVAPAGPDLFVHYLALRALDDPGIPQWDSLVSRFAGRFASAR